MFLKRCSCRPTANKFIKKTNSFKGIFQGLCRLFRNKYFKEHFRMSASVIFLIQIPNVIRNTCSIFFWKSDTYCPKNTWRYHSSSFFSQMLIHPPDKLPVACISEGPKKLNISNKQSLNIALPCLILSCL